MSDILSRVDHSHDVKKLTLEELEQLAEESSGGSATTPALKQDIDNVAVLVHCARKIVPLALYVDEHLVQELVIPQCWLPSSQVVRVMETEATTPTSNGFVANRNSPLREQFFDISQTERETLIQEDSMGDALRWKTKAAID